MKTKILLAVIFMTLQSNWLYSMEAEPDIITLEGRDKKAVQISRALALQSGTLEGIIKTQRFEEAKTGIITLREIPASDLKTVFDLVQAILLHAKKRPEHIGGYITSSVQDAVDALLKDKTPTEIQDLLLASNFLDLPALTNALAHVYVFKQPKLSFEKLTKEEDIVTDLHPLIKRHVLLRDSDIKKELSLADYIAEHGQPKIKSSLIRLQPQLKGIEIQYGYLTNFDGIELLENKDDIQVLKFLNNWITEIPKNIFQNFNNLLFIDLGGNKLTEIPENTFLGLNNLFGLLLDNNILINISENAFKGLVNLKELFLNDNDLRDFNVTLLSDLNRLKALFLQKNYYLSKETKEKIRSYCEEKNIILEI